jgi:hypothetical protein
MKTIHFIASAVLIGAALSTAPAIPDARKIPGTMFLPPDQRCPKGTYFACENGRCGCYFENSGISTSPSIR